MTEYDRCLLKKLPGPNWQVQRPRFLPENRQNWNKRFRKCAAGDSHAVLSEFQEIFG